MKTVLLAATLLLIGTQAQASWAENANKEYPVFTGTEQAVARAQATRNYRHAVRRPYYERRRYERW
jgi:hypothetical protein